MRFRRLFFSLTLDRGLAYHTVVCVCIVGMSLPSSSYKTDANNNGGSHVTSNGEASWEQQREESSLHDREVTVPAISKHLVWRLSGLSSCQGCCQTNGPREKDDDEASGSHRIMDYNLQALASSSPASPLVLAPMLLQPSTAHHQSTVEMVLSEYIAACRFYGSTANSGVLTSLRFALPCLRTSDHFHDTDMLALSEVLLRHCNGPLRYVKRLDFSVSGKQAPVSNYTSTNHAKRRGFQSHGAVALAKVLQVTQHVTQLRLQRNSIGPYGASAIFLACARNGALTTLAMRRCRVGERGALVLAETLRNDTDGQCGLREVDLSANYIGHVGCEMLERAILQRNKAMANSDDATTLTTCDLEGNLVFQEVMNAITHGLGVLLAFWGSFLMSRRVANKSPRAVYSCAVYSTSLIVLYTSSTLYHSFFTMQNTKYIFEVLDKCAIYILIAGSYTPFLQIVLAHEPFWSTGLLSFIWVCGVLGIGIEATLPVWRYRKVFSLSMYLGMGWAAMACLPEVASLLPDNAIRLMVLGGVAYTSGVPFYVRSNNLDHAIWHIFVVVGSFFHWLGIYLYVATWDEQKFWAAQAAAPQ